MKDYASVNILVVEDDAGLREALIDPLSLADYQCVEADSAEAALLLLKNAKIAPLCNRIAQTAGSIDGPHKVKKM